LIDTINKLIIKMRIVKYKYTISHIICG